MRGVAGGDLGIEALLEQAPVVGVGQAERVMRGVETSFGFVVFKHRCVDDLPEVELIVVTVVQPLGHLAAQEAGAWRHARRLVGAAKNEVARCAFRRSKMAFICSSLKNLATLLLISLSPRANVARPRAPKR